MSQAFLMAIGQMKRKSWWNEPASDPRRAHSAAPDNAARRARNGAVREAVLAEIKHSGPVSYAQLEDITGFKKMTLRNHVMRLEETGHVRRVVIGGIIHLESAS